MWVKSAAHNALTAMDRTPEDTVPSEQCCVEKTCRGMKNRGQEKCFVPSNKIDSWVSLIRTGGRAL